MSVLERISELRAEHGGISVNRLEKEAGITRGSMAKWDDHAPAYEKIKKVADYFGVSVAYLLGEEDIKKAPPSTEDGEVDPVLAELDSIIDSLSAEDREKMLQMIKLMFKK